MKKERKKYFQLGLTTNTKKCPICGDLMVTSKLLLVFYDTLNRNIIESVHKVSFCNSCHIPLVTEKQVIEMEKEHPGFHLETKPVQKQQSREYWNRKVSERALPIKNLPKQSFLFIGEHHKHLCGEEHLLRNQYIIHGEKDGVIIGAECGVCKRLLISPMEAKKLMKQYPDYLYMQDAVSWSEVFPDKKMIYLVNVNQYRSNTCFACKGRLVKESRYLKNDKGPKLLSKSMKECEACGRVFALTYSFAEKPYSRYKFSYDFYQEESYRKDGKNGKYVVIKTGDFLTRHNMQGCISRNHSMEDITARIRIADKDGNEFDYEVPAVRCDTCGKLFLLETEYQKIREQGVPLCSIVENEYWRQNGEARNNWSEGDSKGSVMYTHGYNVNVNEDLTEQQRRSILRALITDGVMTKLEICSHLDTLIQRATGQAILENAKKKWERDRSFVETYDIETEVVRVNSITRKTYRRKEA